MPYVITSKCIECSRCQSICPTGAITHNGQHYQIDSERCNDCVGHYSVPQCWAACPTYDGCVSTRPIAPQFDVVAPPRSGDYWDRWFETYNRLVSRLNATQQANYWQQWFDRYSQELSKQLHSHKLAEGNS
jgi:Fe-S-cluster-containing dehydrogenase component